MFKYYSEQIKLLILTADQKSLHNLSISK